MRLTRIDALGERGPPNILSFQAQQETKDTVTPKEPPKTLGFPLRALRSLR